MIIILARVINWLANLLVLLVIIDSILSFFLNPYHPLRNTLDRILRPMLDPIRRNVPTIGMVDLSPLILIFLVEFLSYALVNFLYSL
jgi:YggT family protein